MLDTIFAQTSETLTLPSFLWLLAAGVGCGLVIGLVYMFTHKADGYGRGFVLSVVLMPALIGVVVMMVGSNVARAFSLAGALTIVRYRSLPGSPGDIVYLLFALTVGLTLGIGYPAYAVLLTALAALFLLALQTMKFGQMRSRMRLKVTVPEDLNTPGLLDDILNQHTATWKLVRMKTADFGSLYELVYLITPKKVFDPQAFLDALRTKNANLTISLNMAPQADWETN